MILCPENASQMLLVQLVHPSICGSQLVLKGYLRVAPYQERPTGISLRDLPLFFAPPLCAGRVGLGAVEPDYSVTSHLEVQVNI